MIITIKSYASMKRYSVDLPAGGRLEIPEGTSVHDVLQQLNVPAELPKITLVNGRHRSQDHPLRPGDVLVFFPPLEGG
jgi:sulfur carrier protein ThiS